MKKHALQRIICAWLSIGVIFMYIPVCFAQGVSLQKADMVLPYAYMIPSTTLSDYTIHTIGSEAFAKQENLRIVYVPDTVITINDRAFADCKRLNMILIPETVENFGTDVFAHTNDALCIITPQGSAAAAYAKSQQLRCIELDASRLADCKPAYVAWAMFSCDLINSSISHHPNDAGGFSTVLATDEYLLTLSNYDKLMLGVNNMDSGFYEFIDSLMPGDGSTYMAERYANELGKTLEMMTAEAPIQLNTAVFTDPAKYVVEGIDTYEAFIRWLNDGLVGDHPFVKAVLSLGDDLDDCINSIDDFTHTTNYVLAGLEKYTESQEMVDLLIEMAHKSTDDTFVYAINRLQKEYDQSIAAEFVKGYQNILQPFLLGIAEKGLKEASNAFGLYSLARKSIDLGLKVTGSADFRSRQLNYIALLEVSGAADEIYAETFARCDGSAASLRKLQMLWEFCRCARVRIYDMQAKLFESGAKYEDMLYCKELYVNDVNRPDQYYNEHTYAAMSSMRCSYQEETQFQWSEDQNENDTMGNGDLRTYWKNNAEYYEDWLEYGYEPFNPPVNGYIDGTALGHMGVCYLYNDVEVPDDDFTKLEVFEYMLGELMWDSEDKDKDIFAIRNGGAADLRLKDSEIYYVTKFIDDEFGGWLDEVWEEWYLWHGCGRFDDGLQEFDLLIWFMGSSGGDAGCDYLLVKEGK